VQVREVRQLLCLHVCRLPTSCKAPPSLA
jgi:hypothetical protein